MEELFVCAILCGLGFEKYNKYKETMDRLLELNPTDEIVLDLYDRSYKDAMLHLHSIMDEYTLDYELFGKCLMKELRTIYLSVEIKEFGKKCMSYGIDFLRRLIKWRNRFISYRMQMIVYHTEMKNNVGSYMNLCLSFMNNKKL